MQGRIQIPEGLVWGGREVGYGNGVPLKPEEGSGKRVRSLPENNIFT